MEPRAKLRKALGRVLSEGHPWIFRDALDGLPAEPGRVVTVTDARGRFVARGIADSGPIGVRVWTTRDEPVDGALAARRIEAAAALRDRVIPADTDSYRFLHGEGDRLPGVVCDVYGEWAVLRFDSPGSARFGETLLDALETTLRVRGVQNLIVRSGRRGAGQPATAVFGRLPEGPVDVTERGMKLRADLVRGQKTGLFLDHRESRFRVRQMAQGLSVLDLYGYTGGFSVAAGLGGATRVVTVDIAEAAVDLARQTWEINGLAPGKHTGHASDVRAFLDRAAEQGSIYDLVVADPPSFAPSQAKVDPAIEAYRALHRAALERVEIGGFYLAASCSSHVGREAFEKTVREGARRARRVIQVLERWGAPADHPRLLAFPEGDYLKVLLARVVE